MTGDHTKRERPSLGLVVSTFVGFSLVLTACVAPSANTAMSHSSVSSTTTTLAPSPTATRVTTPSGMASSTLPGMPPQLDPRDVYAADRPNQLSRAVAGDPYRIYVPNTKSNTVTVIDPTTYKVVATYRVGRQPQHVVPSWDLKTLWVNDDLGNTLTAIDPKTTRPVRRVRVHDPYNLYFTPDGKSAVVMASKDQRLVFRDPHSMKVQKVVPAGCVGVNHADWTADGRFFLVSCEFDGRLLWVDTARRRVVARLSLGRGAMPQDVKLSPDGSTFYVADMMSNGVWTVRTHGGAVPTIGRLLPTGVGAHGLYVSRDSTRLFISNRGEGSISVLRFRDMALISKWSIPGGGSPDMGGVSPDGKVLWLSGRFNHVVYAISTTTGALLAKIRVGTGPHGLAVFPQPGRYSLGHTGVFR